MELIESPCQPVGNILWWIQRTAWCRRSASYEDSDSRLASDRGLEGSTCRRAFCVSLRCATEDTFRHCTSRAESWGRRWRSADREPCCSDRLRRPNTSQDVGRSGRWCCFSGGCSERGTRCSSFSPGWKLRKLRKSRSPMKQLLYHLKWLRTWWLLSRSKAPLCDAL